MPLARYAAGRYARGSEPFDDLLQVASIGLLKAIDRYDPARGSAFSSYAMPTMTGELRRYFRDRIWAVRPPRDLQEQALRVEAVIERLTGELGRAPTVAEIAADAALEEEVVLEALEAGRARTGVSLETAAGPDSDGDVQLESLLGRPEAGFAAAEDRATIAALSRTLTRRERLVLSLRFDEDLTQAEIGARVGISQMHVSRIVRGAIDRLRIAAEAAQVGG
jgi:RNA polymerase sigma-B factor